MISREVALLVKKMQEVGVSVVMSVMCWLYFDVAVCSGSEYCHSFVVGFAVVCFVSKHCQSFDLGFVVVCSVSKHCCQTFRDVVVLPGQMLQWGPRLP
jgi:hypothetical protein